MSRCGVCAGRGFTEGWQGTAAHWTPSIQQCPKRCDISAYSREVQRRLSQPVSARQPVAMAMPSDQPARHEVLRAQMRLVR